MSLDSAPHARAGNTKQRYCGGPEGNPSEMQTTLYNECRRAEARRHSLISQFEESAERDGAPPRSQFRGAHPRLFALRRWVRLAMPLQQSRSFLSEPGRGGDALSKLFLGPLDLVELVVVSRHKAVPSLALTSP